MFEFIGIFFVWGLGAALSFYGPLYAGLAWRGGLETIVIGHWAARIVFGAYLAATVIYFIVT